MSVYKRIQLHEMFYIPLTQNIIIFFNLAHATNSGFLLRLILINATRKLLIITLLNGYPR